MNKDAATGLVGALVLVAAMGGVFFYERAQFDTYEVDWEDETYETMTDSGELSEGASSEHNLTVDTPRLAQITAEITWTDDVGEPDTFETRLEGPGEDLLAEDEADRGSITLTLPVHEAPETDTAVGRSVEDARENLNATETWEEGNGEWVLTVTLASAPGDGLVTEDGSQSYEIDLGVDRWEPRLALPS